MCGIAGIVTTSSSVEENKQELASMLDEIKHRGPDATHIWNDESCYLGHNRLSIIDLNSRSDQPFKYEHYVISYNGEVYNYLEIRDLLVKKGHQFLTESDTEVIIHAFAEWGSDCVTQFMGMWSFVIYNRTDKSLFISRDRFGIKPFYFIHSGSNFVFASEIKALKLTRIFRSDLNAAQVARYLQLGWLEFENETFFECVETLPAGCNMKLENGNLTINRYYELDLTQKLEGKNEIQKIDHFRDLFLSSLKFHMRSDVPVGACLSGGIDSSAIVSGLCHMNSEIDLNTFTIYYTGEGDVDERPFVDLVLEKYPIVKGHFRSPNVEEVQDEFKRALYHQDVPPASSSFLSQYFLMKMISDNGIKVVLDGQGSDEYLAGYFHTFYRVIADEFCNLRFKRAFSELKASHRYRESNKSVIGELAKSFLASIFSESKLYELEYRFYEPRITTFKGVPDLGLKRYKGTKTDNFLYNLMFTTSLPNLLHYEDRNSMAFSIESRVPFLDHRLIEFAFSLPTSDKISAGITKRILRESMKGIIPEEVYNRRDKKGFVTPGVDKWGGVFTGMENSRPRHILITMDHNKKNWKKRSIDFWINNNC